MKIAKLLRSIEKRSARLQGKGWGTRTVQAEFKSARKLLGPSPVNLCIDIGGNKGDYTAEIRAAYPNARTVVFEPAKSNYERLVRRFEDDEQVVIEHSAVSRETGKATLFSDEDGSGMASLTKRRLDHFGLDFDREEKVSTVNFHEYWTSQLDRQPIDFCKIDVEGHELDVLEGFGEAILKTSVLQFEFGGTNIDTRTYFQDFWFFFAERHFDIYRIAPIGLMKIDRYTEDLEFFSTTNFLARKKAADH